MIMSIAICRHACGVAESATIPQADQATHEMSAQVLASNSIITTDQQLVSAESMDDDLEVPIEEEKIGEESKRCAQALVKSGSHSKVCLECVETRAHVECLSKSLTEAVSSLNLLRDLIQISCAKNLPASEQIEEVDHMAEGHEKQMCAKFIQLTAQLDKVRKVSDYNSKLPQCDYQSHHREDPARTSLVHELSHKSQVNEAKMESLILQLDAQTKRGDHIENLVSGLDHLKGFRRRIERLERNAAESKISNQKPKIPEKLAEADHLAPAPDLRLDRLEAGLLEMHKYEDLLKRILLLETNTANKEKVNELAMVTLKLGKASATLSDFQSLVQRGDEISERVDGIQAALPSKDAVDQTAKQREIVQSLEGTVNMQAKTLDFLLNNISTLHKDSKLVCVVLKELKDQYDQLVPGRSRIPSLSDHVIALQF